MERPLETSSYRDPNGGLAARYAELRRQRSRELELLPDTVRDVLSERRARVAAGVVAIAGAAALPVATALWGHFTSFFNPIGTDGSLTAIVLATPLLSLAVYLGTRIAARREVPGRLAAALPAPTGDLLTDVAHLERSSARDLVAESLAPRERFSIALPLVGAALLAPLVIHWCVYATIVVLGGNLHDSAWTSLFRNFDAWVILSEVFVGHCHLVLAGFAIYFARRLYRQGTVSAGRAGWWAWLWTWVASTVPGAFLFFIPTALVALTGLFVPLAFWMMGGRIERERRALANG
jgi:hypothetical protein